VARRPAAAPTCCRPAPSPRAPRRPRRLALWQQAWPARPTPPYRAPAGTPPDLISFAALATPSASVEDFGRAIRLAIRRDGVATLGFGEAAGYAPAATIAQLLGIQGIRPPGVDPHHRRVAAGPLPGGRSAALPRRRRAGEAPPTTGPCRSFAPTACASSVAPSTPWA
jgi:hypothetical protein